MSAVRSGYARLARRITTVTTNCLLSAIVLVAGLGFGRQVLTWWQVEAADEVGAAGPIQPADGLGDPLRQHILQFGDQAWSLTRQSVAGDKQTAAAVLRRNCRQVVQRVDSPSEQPAEAEILLLAHMARREPCEQEPDRWRLYELDSVIPVVVGTRSIAGEASASTIQGQSEDDQRVVAWGMTTPASDAMWTVYTFQPAISAAEQPSLLASLPVPDEARRTVSLQVAGGGAFIGFEGPQDAKTLTRFYDQWFRTHNWEGVGPWRRQGSAWQARYCGSGQDRATVVDVHVSTHRRGHDDGEYCGLLMITPSSAGRRPG
ncbi:MAG: hypothetical protein JXB62_03225 [Pirellulales bacterium]|nr:hypothetical protein [Pirellulales bacterium]